MSSTTKKKYVEKELAEDYSLPNENQSILKIIKPRGNNLHQVVTSTGEEFLASMPPKFRKHIWVKRGDFVIAEPIHEGNKVKAEIVRILLKDQIKYYIQENVWPRGFLDEPHTATKSDTQNRTDYVDDEDLLMCNPNKPQITYESEESSSSEDDFDSSGSGESDSENETLSANLDDKCSFEQKNNLHLYNNEMNKG